MGADWAAPCVTMELVNCAETEPGMGQVHELVAPGRGRDLRAGFTIGPKEKEWHGSNGPRSVCRNQNPRSDYSWWNPDRRNALAVVSMAKLAERLQENDSLSLVLIMPPEELLSGSGARETASIRKFSHRFKLPPSVFLTPPMWCGVAAFLQGLDLFVCVDGGVVPDPVACQVRRWACFSLHPARWKPPVPWSRSAPHDDRPTSLPPTRSMRK